MCAKLDHCIEMLNTLKKARSRIQQIPTRKLEKFLYMLDAFLFVKDETSCTLWTRSLSFWPSCAGSNMSQQSGPPSYPAFSSRSSFSTRDRISVADPGCLSRILIFTHPGSRIPDPKTGTKERGEKNLLLYLFLKPQISQNCKLFYFWNAEEKNFSQFSKNYRAFYPKNCH